MLPIRHRTTVAAVLGALLLAAGAGTARADVAPLSVSGNALVAGGAPIELHGVNYQLFQAACQYDEVEPADVPATFAAMKTWGVNVVRLGVDAHCWLGVQGRPAPGVRYATAAAYRAVIQQRIGQLEAQGLRVIIDPQNADYMPDSDITTFWTSAAALYKSDPAIIFDAINEVALGSDNVAAAHPSKPLWDCWQLGCTIDSTAPGRARQAVPGMQTLVDAIRATGATQPILIGSPGYDSDVGQWLTHVPSDPLHALILDQHRYDFVDDNGGAATTAQTYASFDAYLSNDLAPIARQYPVMFGELGEDHCDDAAGGYVAHVLDRLDALRAADGLSVSVVGWEWRVPDPTYYGCPTSRPGAPGFGGPLLIRDYDGTPNLTGAALRQWFLARSTPVVPPVAPPAGGPGPPPGPVIPPEPRPPATVTVTSARSDARGTVTLRLRVSAAGRLYGRAQSRGLLRRVVRRHAGHRRVTHTVLPFATTTVTAPAAGALKLTLRPEPAARRYLLAHRRIALNVRLLFSPTGGPVATQLNTTAVSTMGPRR